MKDWGLYGHEKPGKAIEFKKNNFQVLEKLLKIFLLRVYDVHPHAAGRVFMGTVAYVQISAQS